MLLQTSKSTRKVWRRSKQTLQHGPKVVREILGDAIYDLLLTEDKLSIHATLAGFPSKVKCSGNLQRQVACLLLQVEGRCSLQLTVHTPHWPMTPTYMQVDEEELGSCWIEHACPALQPLAMASTLVIFALQPRSLRHVAALRCLTDVRVLSHTRFSETPIRKQESPPSSHLSHEAGAAGCEVYEMLAQKKAQHTHPLPWRVNNTAG